MNKIKSSGVGTAITEITAGISRGLAMAYLEGLTLRFGGMDDNPIVRAAYAVLSEDDDPVEVIGVRANMGVESGSFMLGLMAKERMTLLGGVVNGDRCCCYRLSVDEEEELYDVLGELAEELGYSLYESMEALVEAPESDGVLLGEMTFVYQGARGVVELVGAGWRADVDVSDIEGVAELFAPDRRGHLSLVVNNT